LQSQQKLSDFTVTSVKSRIGTLHNICRGRGLNPIHPNIRPDLEKSPKLGHKFLLRIPFHTLSCKLLVLNNLEVIIREGQNSILELDTPIAENNYLFKFRNIMVL